MAQGNTANGCDTKKTKAKLVAKPAFCMPTSMLMVRFFAVLNFAARPANQPST